MNHNDFRVYGFLQSIQRKLIYEWDQKDMAECSIQNIIRNSKIRI